MNLVICKINNCIYYNRAAGTRNKAVKIRKRAEIRASNLPCFCTDNKKSSLCEWICTY